VQRSIGDLPSASLTDCELIRARCEIVEILGPAVLAYLDPAEFRPQHGSAVIHPQDEEMSQFLVAADTEDDLSVLSPPQLPGLSRPTPVRWLKCGELWEFLSRHGGTSADGIFDRLAALRQGLAPER